MSYRGSLIVISAASGTGKTSLASALAHDIPKTKISISYTTRALRAGETANESYFFVDDDEFARMIKADAFLEYAHVMGHYYGTGKEWVYNQLQEGYDVLLTIDWQGARLVRQAFPETISIFLLPPSLDTLQKRLEIRKREGTADIKKRLLEANRELAHLKEFDYIVVNDVFERALGDLKNILLARRLRTSRQLYDIKDLLERLAINN